MRVAETRLVEQPCPDGCGATERRAFGEIESRHGELASYAFGWTSGHEDEVARMTIGMGVGNEGGGSFHMEVVLADGSWGMGLVDEPFEQVPEGGPDLTRDEALAHDTLPFIWDVADNVMAQDRRAWWMLHWLEGTGAFVTGPVLRHEQPVLHVVLDEEDDVGEGELTVQWSLLCGTVEPDEDAHIAHLFHALDHDQALLEILDLEHGQRADRDNRRRRWKRSLAG